MPYGRTSLAAFIFWTIALGACTQQSELSGSIARNFKASDEKTVDLATAVPGHWERVCILGPYANNAAAKQALGFDWDIERKTSIQTNEGISLLLFVQGKSVAHYTEHTRTAGDFTNLAGRCFDRAAAIFVQVPTPNKGWQGLFPKDEA